jgi:uncharacterized repeat protein (TIGR02543 family)
MGRRVALFGVVLAFVLALGVGSAGGHSLATTTVTVQVIGKGRVTSSAPPGVQCGDGKETCYVAFTRGATTITLVASDSASSWRFDNWGGDCSGSGSSCDLTGSTDYQVTANFAGPATGTSTLSVSAITGATTFPLSVTVTGDGTVTGGGITCGTGGSVCSANETAGSTVTLTATGDGGATHTWGGACSGTAATCSVTMSSAQSVTATFSTGSSTVGPGTVPAPVASGGTVAGDGIDCGSSGTACTSTVLTGSTLTVLETPDTGFVFNGWGGACSDKNVACTIEMSDDRSLSASWSESSSNTPTVLTVTISGNGTVEGAGLDCTGPATCTASTAADTTVTLEATPKDGNVFTGWSGTNSCTGTGSTCTLTMDVDRAVTATFTPAIQLAVGVMGNGNVSGGLGAINCGNGAEICSANFALNSTQTLIATPATGATFTGWTGACGGTATTCTVAMSASRSVNATFIGGAPPGTATLALNVTVTGNGTVTGGGIRCGSGAPVCTANQTPNAVVTLVATPSPGATFVSWGGACTVTTTTCTVTMTAATFVTATFSTGSPSTVQLSVTVTGRGSVKGGAINCGNGATACSANLAPNTTITLTAAPVAGQTFKGWGGACAGTKTTCPLTVTAATTVIANFSGTTAGGGGTAAGALKALGRPLVKRTAKGFVVTLRFRTQQAGTAQVTGRRAGRLLTSLSIRVPAGNATIGPFPVSKPGSYTFEIRLGSNALHWRTCLGRCGAAATAAPFRLLRETPVVKRTGAVWSVTLRFRASAISDAHIAVRRGGKLLSDRQFLGGAREIIVGPFLLGPGSYTFTLRAVDAYGRVRTLTWIADLAR